MYALSDLVSGPFVLAFSFCVSFSLTLKLEINMAAIFNCVLSVCASLRGSTQMGLTSKSLS
jgi:hypothetical protein